MSARDIFDMVGIGFIVGLAVGLGLMRYNLTGKIFP
jgi:uncharacterized membrane-anchored protein YhcB (DUF1043 family)